MKFKKIIKTMTKEEFLNNKRLTNHEGCPCIYGLKDVESCEGVTCKECWQLAIEKGNVRFKDDTTNEQKVIDALKVVQDYCFGKDCKECAFDWPITCKIADSLGSSWAPSGFKLEILEDSIKPQILIYKVEHSKGGKQYTFVADEDLPIGTMVICDTKYGQSYGKIVDAFKGVDDGNKKCWRAK
jgi:hypothetical protein